MRRWTVLIAAPALLSAAAPVAEAERAAREAELAQKRLEQAAAGAKSAAQRAAAEAAAAGEAMLAADARIAMAEGQLAELRRRQAALEHRLAVERRPAAALLAGLVQLGRRPQWLALAGSGSAEEQVRLAALVRQVRPEVDRRTADLRGELEALRQLGARQERVRAELGRNRQAAAAARQRFAALERDAMAVAARRGNEAVAAEDQVLDRAERASALRSQVEQRRARAALAAALAQLPAAEPRPVGPAERPPSTSFEWTVPAAGAVTVGLGELLPNGVRARGLTIAAAAGTQVIAPAAGRVAFAGPFRRRSGVVIVDHGDGRMTLLSDLRPRVRVGDRIVAGQPIGRALGPVTAELFQGGTAEPTALIARSS